MGQRHHPGHPDRRALRAVRLRALADVRGHEGRQPGARRPRGDRRLRRARRHHRHPHPGAVVVRDRGADHGRARLRAPADLDPGGAGPWRAHHAAGDVRPLGGDRERAAAVHQRRQPLARGRRGHRHRLVLDRLADPALLPAATHLRRGRGGPARPAVLPVRVPVRPDDPGRGRRPGGGPAVRNRLPARVRHRGGDRVRHGGAGRHRVRHVLAVLADHGHRHDPALRVRRGGDRRPRLAVGHAARRHRARRRPADRRPDQPVQPVPGRLPRLPARARAPAPGPYCQEGAARRAQS